MSISLKTNKKLWGHSANRCAFENCRKELVVDTFNTDDHYTIGDEAHIISKRKNGPRSKFKNNFSLEQIDKYDNLILLCKEHHKSIDSDEIYYTLEKVRAIKQKHENWVRANLQIDQQQQKDDELFADYIDQIEGLANFDKWLDWTAPLLGGHFTRIKKRQYKNLIDLHKYIRERVFPHSRQSLVDALNQFNLVLEDFINEFDIYKWEDENDKMFFITQQLYRFEAVTPERQNLHEYMLEELIIELTKAGNYLCEQVRQTIFPTYRLNAGILLLKDAPIMGTAAYRRFLYTNDEKYCGFFEVKKRTQKLLGQE